ncbi:MAG: calcineurin-like phosphoesterase C-terminal domain-containing protein [Bacteroidales bacterium]|nr:calcineurin-like phosphoesterase C-terminal domain-containing protein [Bacteroidales bacterium]
MKKNLISLLLTALCGLVFSCTAIQETDPISPEKPIAGGLTQVITGQLDESDTKANITNAGVFTWTESKDIVAVHLCNDGEGIHRYIASSGASASAASADFSVTTSEAATYRDAFALYPSYLVDCSSAVGPANYGQDGSPLDLSLPGSYTLAQVAGVHTPVAMIASNTAGGNWSFKHLGAMLRVIINNVPGNTAKIAISMPGKKIWGDFSIPAPVIPGTSQLETSDDPGYDTVTITDLNFNPDTPFYDGVRISIPLPTGTYPSLSIICYDSSDNVLRQQIERPVNYTLPRRGGALLTVTLGGVTINAAGDQVVFAPGNLQAFVTGDHPIDTGYVKSVSQWRFAENQYDVIEGGNTFANDTWVDLFSWQGASSPMAKYFPNYGVCTYASAGNDDIPKNYYTNGGSSNRGEALASDWGNLPIDNYTPGTWRTPDSATWEYVFNTRDASTVNGIDNARYVRGYINSSLRGIILFPDYYTHPESGVTVPKAEGINNPAKAVSYSAACSLTSEQWKEMEKLGCTFIPLGGYRQGLTFNKGNSSGTSAEARYCASNSSTGSAKKCYYFGYTRDALSFSDTWNKPNAGSVRLIRDIRSGVTDKTLDTAPDVTEAGTVFGWVSCKGKGVPGVVVSDGTICTQTNEEGVYSLSSDKANGYVFISTPSGYVAPTVGVLPTIHKLTKQAAGTPERIDFELVQDGDQTNHTMLVVGDMHLANRYSDIAGFQRFTDDVTAYKAANAGKKVYALTLGDMTWDIYWIPRNESGNAWGTGAGVGFKEYLTLINQRVSGIPIYHTIGNHDHSMFFAGDVETVKDYKQNIAPTYYSFNIGNVHYIVLDDILCTNTGNTSDSSYGRSYNTTVTSAQLTWLERDLSYVSTSTPLVVATHAPLYREDGVTRITNSSALIDILDNYPEVHLFSGHTHNMYNIDNRATNHIFEHNAGSICGSWWWTYHCTKSNSKIIVSQDGTPAGYTVLDVADKSFSWQYKPVGREITHQFRSYDRNEIAITKANFYPNCTDSAKDEVVNTAAENWNTASSANEVYLNIWNWDPSWTISVTEGGTPLVPTRVTRKDPLQTIAYIAIRANGNNAVTFPATNSNHFWKVTASSPTSTLNITVTDGFGNVYNETMTRPKAFELATYPYTD